MTLHFRLFMFKGIPMLVIRLHVDFFRTVRRVGGGGMGVKKTPRRIHISRLRIHRMEDSSAKHIYFEFHDHIYTGIFFMTNVSLGLKSSKPYLISTI